MITISYLIKATQPSLAHDVAPLLLVLILIVLGRVVVSLSRRHAE